MTTTWRNESYSVETTKQCGPATVNVTKYCDGWPRVSQPCGLVTKTVGTYTSGLVTVAVTDKQYPVAPPNCTIADSDCSALWASQTSAASWSYANGYASAANYPHCTLPQEKKCLDCTITADHVRLLYWPPATVYDVCGYENRTTVPLSQTGAGPNTAIFDGTTLTSPSVYLSFAAVSAKTGYGGDCGKPSTEHALVALDPKELSSQRGPRNWPDGKYSKLEDTRPN